MGLSAEDKISDYYKNQIKMSEEQGELDFSVPEDYNLDNAIKALILESAIRYKNNKTRMARALGISISSLYKKIKEHKLGGIV